MGKFRLYTEFEPELHCNLKILQIKTSTPKAEVLGNAPQEMSCRSRQGHAATHAVLLSSSTQQVEVVHREVQDVPSYVVNPHPALST